MSPPSSSSPRPDPIRFGIAFGSNIGDRLENLRKAKTMLIERTTASAGDTPIFSSVYESDPVGCEEGATAFLNAVGEISFAGTPRDLLLLCQEIEVELGRPSRRPKNVPRVIDLDLLYGGRAEVSTAELTLPHPLLGERRFVLEPLASIRPDLRLPGDDRTIEERLRTLRSPEPPLRVVAERWE